MCEVAEISPEYIPSIAKCTFSIAMLDYRRVYNFPGSIPPGQTSRVCTFESMIFRTFPFGWGDDYSFPGG